MRDPERIYDFCKDFAQYWYDHFPDLRFGQLCCNFFGWLDKRKGLDPFFIEENQMLKYLHEYHSYLKGECHED